MKQSLFLVTFLLVFVTNDTFSQYKVSNNKKIRQSGEQRISSGYRDDVYSAASLFFNLPKQGKRHEWESILSKNCLKNAVSVSHTNEWWQMLSTSSYQYTITKELPAVKTNQKTLCFNLKNGRDSITGKSLVLVRERGSWRVLSAQL